MRKQANILCCGYPTDKKGKKKRGQLKHRSKKKQKKRVNLGLSPTNVRAKRPLKSTTFS
jgi:hypothetical protein